MEDNQKKGKKISTTVLKDENFYNRQKSDLKIILIGDSEVVNQSKVITIYFKNFIAISS